MSSKRIVKTFEVVEIKLEEINNKNLIELEDKLCNILLQNHSHE